MEYKIAKGVFDVLPEEPHPEDAWRNSDHWQYVESVIRACCADYGFKEIRTPIFERTELFVRGVGEGSDIVSKEMYTFMDKGERSMTLRPEGTASVMRAFVEKNLAQKSGLHKFFYIGPMFRYERPQAGRYRQHHQFGAEAIGVGKPEQDVEMMDMLYEFYRRLGLKNLKVMINSVGDESSRAPFKEALTAYLTPHFQDLSADSQVRFSKNILRILDSKDTRDQEFLKNAPTLEDYLTEEVKEHFEKVKSLLSQLKIPYAINPKLVRGLDYYNKTVFEITSDVLGAQNSIGGGGRYDGLTALLGGPNLPAFGFGTGLERLLQTMAAQGSFFPEPSHPVVFFVPMGEEALQKCFEFVVQLRHAGIAADIDLSGKKIQNGLQLAVSEKAKYCMVVGQRELDIGKAELKEMATRETQVVALTDLLNILRP